MPSISKQVRDAVRNRMADPVEGFNAVLASIADSYGIEPFEISWNFEDQTFFQGNVSPQELPQSSDVIYPCAVLYTTTLENQNIQKWYSFSGTVRVSIDFYLSYLQGNAAYDFESLPDAVEDAFFTTLGLGADPAFIAAGIVFNGGITTTRGQCTFGAANWQQVLSFNLTFERHIS